MNVVNPSRSGERKIDTTAREGWIAIAIAKMARRQRTKDVTCQNGIDIMRS